MFFLFPHLKFKLCQKTKKKTKKSRRNSTIIEDAQPEGDLLEVKQDPLPALQEIPEAELQTQRGSAEDEIEKLAGLHKRGILTDEEFSAQKAQPPEQPRFTATEPRMDWRAGMSDR